MSISNRTADEKKPIYFQLPFQSSNFRRFLRRFRCRHRFNVHRFSFLQKRKHRIVRRRGSCFRFDRCLWNGRFFGIVVNHLTKFSLRISIGWKMTKNGDKNYHQLGLISFRQFVFVDRTIDILQELIDILMECLKILQSTR